MTRLTIICENGSGEEPSFRSPIEQLQIREGNGKVVVISNTEDGWQVRELEEPV